eukprot:5608634-Prymnesium_polylepis.1
MQMTLKASHPQSLPDAVAKMGDVIEIFGKVPMQASLVERCEHRDTFHLVGRAHDLGYWKEGDKRMPRLESFRSYYAQELYPSEKKWVPAIFDRFYESYFNDPLNPLLVYLPEEPLAENAQVAYLVGNYNGQPGVLYEFFVYKAQQMVQAYAIMSHGRRFYRALTYTSDARFCLRSMQPSTDDRSGLWPAWERHAAGNPKATFDEGPSVVITREWAFPDNLSLGTETYMPSQLLLGIIPQVIFRQHSHTIGSKVSI